MFRIRGLFSFRNIIHQMNPLATQQTEFLPTHIGARVMVDENDTIMTKILTQRKANFWKLETEIIIVFFFFN